jgi:hypothetical protein
VPSSLKDLHPYLPKAIQCLCVHVKLPPDDGVALSQYIQTSSKPLYGAADASFNDSNTSHAWVLSTDNIEDLANPIMNISGSGPVDGHPHDMSSSRGELQEGQTALVALSNPFFGKFNIQHHPVHVTGDNQGVMD